MENKKYEELAKDHAFIDSLAEAKTPEEMQKIFASQGISLTLEEVAEFIKTAENGGADELDEKVLDDVSGGCLPVVAGLAIIAIALYAKRKYRK